MKRCGGEHRNPPNASDEEQEYDVAGILVWRCGLEPFISRDTRIMHLLVGKLGG
jgi:hypothetical protein